MLNNPLILTLKLDTRHQQYFNSLRREHFPPERNYLDAHLTLFHHLPANEKRIIQAIIHTAANYAPMLLQVTGIKSIGNGVAFVMECSKLQALHKQLQQEWGAWLIPQDRQKLWPHITVQNKVNPEAAKELKQKLEQDFTPFGVTGIGLSLFEYQGGPWQWLEEFNFSR